MQLGDQFNKWANAWQGKLPIIGDVRGIGAMQALEIVQADGSRKPDAEATKNISRYCYEHGVILVTAGTASNVIRLLMPLVISDEQLDEALDVIGSALAEVSRKESALTEVPAAMA